jgi:thioredoxin 2
MTESRHIVCPHCGSINRLPADRDCAPGEMRALPQAPVHGGAIPVSGKSFDAHVRTDDIPVVVDFWAQWCGPCKAMAPVYERVAAEMEPNMRFLKVDTEREPELAARYGIQGHPDPDGAAKRRRPSIGAPAPSIRRRCAHGCGNMRPETRFSCRS